MSNLENNIIKALKDMYRELEAENEKLEATRAIMQECLELSAKSAKYFENRTGLLMKTLEQYKEGFDKLCKENDHFVRRNETLNTHLEAALARADKAEKQLEIARDAVWTQEKEDNFERGGCACNFDPPCSFCTGEQG